MWLAELQSQTPKQGAPIRPSLEAERQFVPQIGEMIARTFIGDSGEDASAVQESVNPLLWFGLVDKVDEEMHRLEPVIAVNRTFPRVHRDRQLSREANDLQDLYMELSLNNPM